MSIRGISAMRGGHFIRTKRGHAGDVPVPFGEAIGHLPGTMAVGRHYEYSNLAPPQHPRRNRTIGISHLISKLNRNECVKSMIRPDGFAINLAFLLECFDADLFKFGGYTSPFLLIRRVLIPHSPHPHIHIPVTGVLKTLYSKASWKFPTVCCSPSR